MRRFTVCHLSDIHISRAEELSTRVLLDGLRVVLRDLGPEAAPKPHIIVVTGDTVDSPTRAAVAGARAFVGELESIGQHVYVVPGNHDVRRCGFLWRGGDFVRAVGLKPNLFLRPVGLHLVGINSTFAHLARGAVASQEQDSIDHVCSQVLSGLPPGERASLLRIGAMHHHPLPIADAEGARVFGLVREEPYTYLKKPASVLQACLRNSLAMVLHGHRHVCGLTKYSVLSTNYSGRADVLWNSVYVLACPSGTGKDNTYGGFNVISCTLGPAEPFAELRRYARHNTGGEFARLDQNYPGGVLKLPLSPALRRDPTIDARAQLSGLARQPLPDHHVLPAATELFRRRAFHVAEQRQWHVLLYVYLRTMSVWLDDVMPRQQPSRRKPGEAVRVSLGCLVDVTRSALGMPREDLDAIMRSDEEQEALRLRPVSAEVRAGSSWHGVHQLTLKELSGQLAQCGIDGLCLGDRWQGEGQDE